MRPMTPRVPMWAPPSPETDTPPPRINAEEKAAESQPLCGLPGVSEGQSPDTVVTSTAKWRDVTTCMTLIVHVRQIDDSWKDRGTPAAGESSLKRQFKR